MKISRTALACLAPLLLAATPPATEPTDRDIEDAWLNAVVVNGGKVLPGRRVQLGLMISQPRGIKKVSCTPAGAQRWMCRYYGGDTLSFSPEANAMGDSFLIIVYRAAMDRINRAPPSLMNEQLVFQGGYWRIPAQEQRIARGNKNAQDTIGGAMRSGAQAAACAYSRHPLDRIRNCN